MMPALARSTAARPVPAMPPVPARLRPALLLVSALAACATEQSVPDKTTGAELATSLAASSDAPRPGDTILVRLVATEAGGRPLGMLQGRLRFDPARLGFAGQEADPAARVDLVHAGQAEAGVLHLLSYSARGLGDTTAVLAFVVRTEGDPYAGLAYELALAATSRVEPLERARFTGVHVGGTGPAAPPALLDVRAWSRLLGYPPQARLGPGQYVLNLRFGDATVDGVINGLDALHLANVTVSQASLIVGTDSPSRDAVVAGNVWPANLPLLGGIGDPLPPGQEPSGSREINGLDVLVVSRENVGFDDPVVGELIPGRGAPITGVTPVSGTLAGTTVWPASTVYSLQGNVVIPAGATLTIERGVRIEAAVDGAGLEVQPGGRIVAEGTALEPVTFTCVSFTGCSSALSWTGNASTNPTEDAGSLRYVRVEGFAIGMWLTRLGSGTLLDYVQVAGRSGQPISAAFALNGGAVGLRHLVLGPHIAGPAMSITGWSGRAQHIILRPRTVASGWLLHAILPSATPPQLYNITAAAEPGSADGGYPRFSAGANGIIRNLLLYQTGLALNLEDAATCTEVAAGRLRIEHSLFLGLTTNGNPDTDPAGCGGYTSPTVEQEFLADPTAANRFLPAPATSELVGGDEPTLWDLRPRPGSLAATGGATPPNDGFFDPTATYVGAVPPSTTAGGNIPWYAGWIFAHAGGATYPAPAGIAGTLTSSLGGPLEGVTVSVSGGYGGTASDNNGDYSVGGWPGGDVTVTFGNVPVNCTAPAPQLVSTTAGTATTLNLTIPCTPLAGTVTGTVSSPELGPLTGSTVLITPGPASTTVDAAGDYTLSGLAPGPVSVELTGLPTICAPPPIQAATVTAGASTPVSFTVTCTPVANGSALLLTYICGNTFRVRNPNYVAMPVTWDVAGTAETGALTLPPRLPGSSYTETFFTTVATGTVRLYHNGIQVQVKANGGFVCAP